MSTKYFCDRCEAEVERLIWWVELSQTGVFGGKKVLCEDCKESFERWENSKQDERVITDKQIRKVLDLTSSPFKYTIGGGPIHREGIDTDLGPEENLVEEARKVLGITGERAQTDEPLQTPQEELVDMPAVRAVQDKGEGCTVQGEENPS